MFSINKNPVISPDEDFLFVTQKTYTQIYTNSEKHHF